MIVLWRDTFQNRKDVTICQSTFHWAYYMHQVRSSIVLDLITVNWALNLCGELMCIETYLPQDKGQVKEIPVRALKTKIMPWITTFTFAIIMRCHVNGILGGIWMRKGNWMCESLFKCKKRFAYNLTERKRYIKQESHIGVHIWFSA